MQFEKSFSVLRVAFAEVCFSQVVEVSLVQHGLGTHFRSNLVLSETLSKGIKYPQFRGELSRELRLQFQSQILPFAGEIPFEGGRCEIDSKKVREDCLRIVKIEREEVRPYFDFIHDGLKVNYLLHLSNRNRYAIGGLEDRICGMDFVISVSYKEYLALKKLSLNTAFLVKCLKEAPKSLKPKSKKKLEKEPEGEAYLPLDEIWAGEWGEFDPRKM